MRAKLVVLSVAACSILSCSDFLNSKNSSAPVGEQGAGVGGQGPGPVTGTGKMLPVELRNMNEGEFSEAKMVANIGTNVIAKNILEFSLQATLLKTHVTKYCEDLSGGTVNPASEKAAKDQWEATMLAYHIVDSASFGPAQEKGRLIADNIYSWPFFNVCGVDLEVEKLSKTKTLNKKASSNRRGLGALEYLLFEKDLKTACDPQAEPQMAAWAQKQALEKKVDRCALAQFYADDVAEKAQALNQAWAPDQNNYTVNLVDGSAYPTAIAAVNAISDSLFALEIAKDKKIGAPLGLNKDCSGERCPEMVEHRWSDLGLQALAARVEGFKNVFYGASNSSIKAFGFDDFMIAKGHPELVQQMEEAINRAMNDVNSLSERGNFVDQINAVDFSKCPKTNLDAATEPLCVLYRDVRFVTNSHKADVLTVLSLTAPATFQGDND